MSSTATSSSDADGVLVASAWRNAADDLLVRITMTQPGGVGDTVCTAASRAEAMACFDEWLTTLSL
jgi:hypothetical protein